MMRIQDIRDGVSSLFVMLNKESFVLFRIEFLVVLATVLFLLMFIMDVFRRHIRNTMMTAIFSILDAVSDSIVLYLLGAMQTASFTNQLFPVWALVLVSIRYNIDFISGYGVHDRHGRRFREWRNVVKLLGSAFLNSRGSRFAIPIWFLLALLILRSFHRLSAYGLALCSVWHGKSSEVVTEYMHAGPHTSNWKPEECKPENDMEGYKYLVHGETQREIRLKKPRYVLYIDADRSGRGFSSLVTLDKIWGCRKHRLHPDNNKGNDPKDLSLAFALSRLLRCRLEDVTLQQEIFCINRKLVKTKILEEQNTDRAFRIMELQLSFVNEYFNTRYPMVFWNGFYSLFLNLLLSAVNLAVVFWLLVDICQDYSNNPTRNHRYNPPKNHRAHVVHGFNVDMFITFVFIVFMVFKEIWEIVSYLISDWTRLLLVCSYTRQEKQPTRNKCMERTISSIFKSRVTTKQWHGLIDQYVFLESYDDRPRFWNLLHKMTTGMVPKKDDGATLRNAIDVPGCVRPAILKKLSASLEKLSSPDIVHDQPDNPNRNHGEQGQLLPKAMTSLYDADGERMKRYGWACFDLPTCSHVILVWHIATSLCEMKLARGHGVDLSKYGFLGSLLSCFTSCCSSKTYLMDVEEKTKAKKKVNEKLLDKLQEMYIIANSLSRYCAYLLVSKPDLLPDSFCIPNMVLQETVTCARDDILKNCDSLQSKYDKLMEEAEKVIQDADDIMKKEDVVRLGAKLGKELIDQESQEECWGILSEVWADLLVHIAPTWNAEAHKECLESGGEFITYIWALLWHCGIEKSKLWPVEDVYENDPRGTPPQDNSVRNNSGHRADQTCAAGPRDKTETDIQRSEMQQVHAEERNELNTDTVDHQNGQGSNVVVRGMRNGGNTCYFNAVLQSLLALDKLRARMLGPDALTGDLGQELQKLFIMTTNTNGARGVLMSDKFFSYMCKRKSDFKPGVMEDSNNMLRSLLNGLDNEDHSQPTMVESLFHSQVVKYVSSKECKHTSITFEDLDLSLAIPPKKHASIEDCLDLYVTGVIDDWYCTDCSAAGNASLNQEGTTVNDSQHEQLDNKTYMQKESSYPADEQTMTTNQNNGKLPVLDNNANQMEERHKKLKEEEKIYRTAIVQYHITKAAPILTIQLKRFDYSHPDKLDKLQEHVSFQDTLHITKFMHLGY
uniref:USP domain-containing protein n=1 Tax=Aegilops tauschii subsp. strangulata TaxID=200361 RepID=A0A452ZBE6_AEGTS